MATTEEILDVIEKATGYRPGQRVNGGRIISIVFPERGAPFAVISDGSDRSHLRYFNELESKTARAC